MGNVIDKMTEGIDNAMSVVVFVTRRYSDKVAWKNSRGNCKLEFNYATNTKKSGL